MSSNDHDDHEIAAFFEHTPAGFKAGLKSRAASAVDFMLGRAIGRKGRRDQRLEDAVTDQQVRLIQKLGDMRLEQLEKDTDFAADAMEQHFATIIRRQDNKAEVVKLALEDLREGEPSNQSASDTSEKLSQEFLGRFERYAEDASTSEVRERWARVLASEIRRPGVFSAKVLRLIDETEPSTAKLFEGLCKYRVGNGIVRCLIPKLDYMDLKRLVSSGLIVEQGDTSQASTSSKVNDPTLGPLDAIKMGKFALAVKSGSELPHYDKSEPQAIVKAGDGAGVPIILLTDEGHAISSIIEIDEVAAWEKLVLKASQSLSSLELLDFRPNSQGSFVLARVLNKGANPA